MRFDVRRWWPTLALAAFGLSSVALLHSDHVRSRDVLHQTIAALDNVAESRRRLLNAFLVHQRQAVGDATFAQSSPLAELMAAEHALENWVAGRSGLVDFRATAPDQELNPPREAYEETLHRFREAILAEPQSPVDLRRRFAEAERAAARLERAIRETVRTSVRAEERAYRLRLGGWALLLMASVVGATYARRALQVAEVRTLETSLRLARLREVAPVGIAECDPRGRILAANRMWCTLTDRPETRWLGRPWWESLDQVDQERARSLWLRDPADGQATAEARLHGRRAGNSSADWVLIHVGDGGASGREADRRVVTFTDIRRQREIEEQLRHAQRMEAVGRLAGGVAHDFNNLLTSIGGFASLVLAEIEANDSVAADLQEIQRAAQRGRALTRQLLTFSRQERSDPQVLDARDVVRDVSRMLDQLVADDVRIDIVLSESPAMVLADSGQLEQVVTNLVINASDAMNGRGRIRIAVQSSRVEETFRGAKTDIPPGNYVLLSVSDSGPGIPADVRERMFEPFFTTKERGKGTGLGLSTVWGIVHQSGGHVHVYSAEGQGTVFKIYYPSADAEILAGTPPKMSSTETALAAGVVLVVEDEEPVRRLTRRILELRGWEVHSAEGGEEALRIAREQNDRIDLLVTDLMMRGMSGPELVRRVRAMGLDVRILFVSGYADPNQDLGGAPLLEKPFAPGELVRSVEAVMRADASSP